VNQRYYASEEVDPDISFATLSSGLCVPYIECGSGDPLVFVHGSLCDYRYWTPQLSALSQNFRCIAPSLSHYWPAANACIQQDFGWESHLSELAEFVIAMGLTSVNLVGHSRGGCIAYQLARRYPQLVSALVLADPGGPLQLDDQHDASLPPATNTLRTRVAELILSGAVEAGLELFVDSVSMPGAWRRSSQAFRRMAIDNAATLPEQFEDPLPGYSRASAADVTCRTFLIEGQKSPRMFRNNVSKLFEWMPLADQVTIAGASHGMNAANPAAFNRAVSSFVKGHAVQGTLSEASS
jgi:pimeloyl-ACP methyl ester carboxylesterase